MPTTQEIASLYDAHMRQLYRFFYSRVLSRDQAEDLTSETFLVFVRHCREDRAIVDPVKYLYGIAKHVFLKHLQHKYAEPVSLEEVGEQFAKTVEDELDQAETQTLEERLLPYLRQLPEKQRVVLTARLIDKKTPAEIATLLGKDVNYVRVTQKRATKAIKALIHCTPLGTN
ncbi:MAG TPA: sigma-70 family RNA polymerase sigma factor [bacterium]|nr:sigma-70 family RNA polymerase sigma factor [bacterium]